MSAGAVECVLHHVHHHEHRLDRPEIAVEADEQNGGQLGWRFSWFFGAGGHGHRQDEQREEEAAPLDQASQAT